jgi:hypothetical protein
LIVCPDNTWRIESGNRRGSFRPGSAIPMLEQKEIYEQYYAENYESLPHVNFIATHPKDPPVAISILSPADNEPFFQALVRTAKSDERFFVEKPKSKSKETSKLLKTLMNEVPSLKKYKIVGKQAIEFEWMRIGTEIDHCFHSFIHSFIHSFVHSEQKSRTLVDKLIEFENSQVVTHAKFGILYAKDGQKEEEEMYNNGMTL